MKFGIEPLDAIPRIQRAVLVLEDLDGQVTAADLAPGGGIELHGSYRMVDHRQSWDFLGVGQGLHHLDRRSMIDQVELVVRGGMSPHPNGPGYLVRVTNLASFPDLEVHRVSR